MPKSRRHGVVSIAALDVRRRPDHRAELTSQLLVGEVVRVLGMARGGRWLKVENRADGYRGWVKDWGVVEASQARVRRWIQRARARVVALFVEARARPGAGPLVSPLFWNGRVIPGSTRDGYRRVELPDGRRGWVPRATLASDRAARGAVARGGLAARVRGLLGVPYLWGGRTPLGFDCSGFTQQVLAEQGLLIPRDADAQFQRSQTLAHGVSPREGDLIFFRAPGEPVGHVGLGLGGGYYAHCRRVVRVSSVDPRNELYDKELAPQFAGWKRPRKKAKPGRPAASRRGDSA